MERVLDLSQATEYDLIVAKDRSLSVNITCTYLDVTGSTQYFDLTPYSGATMVIKNQQGTILMTFSTADGSIVLGAQGVFKLVKTAAQMDVVRAGSYNYDMYLSSAIYPKRGFLRGKITFIQNIAN